MIPENVRRSIRRLAHNAAPVYDTLLWKWQDIKAVPTEVDIALALVELYLDAIELDAEGAVGTGGLEVAKHLTEEGNPYYTFAFKIEEEADDT